MSPFLHCFGFDLTLVFTNGVKFYLVHAMLLQVRVERMPQQFEMLCSSRSVIIVGSSPMQMNAALRCWTDPDQINRSEDNKSKHKESKYQKSDYEQRVDGHEFSVSLTFPEKTAGHQAVPPENITLHARLRRNGRTPACSSGDRRGPSRETWRAAGRD